ncbi:MAG: 4Fe-4S binding protein, partial [Promethearchaeota archaeon]
PIEQSFVGPFSNISGSYNMLEYYISNAIIPYLIAGILILFGFIFGRSTCSWVCPFGFIQDLIGYFPQTKIKPVQDTEDLLSNIPYVIILISLGLCLLIGVDRSSSPLAAPLGPFSNGPYTLIDPYVTLMSEIPWRLINGSFPAYTGDIFAYFGDNAFLWVQIFFLLIVLFINIWIPRVFCRYICPTGIILGHFNEFSWFGLRRDPIRCLKEGCRTCEEVCPMNIPILKLPYDKIQHRKCIYCLKCIEQCPENALKLYPS